MQSIISNRNFGLDALRAFAISLVVVSHITYLLFPEGESAIVIFTRVMGAVRVDLFFVLSGFLIGGILLKAIHKKKVNLSNLLLFWKRRWLRTLPNYFVVLGINILLLLVFSSSLPDRVLSYFMFFQNFTSPHPDFFTEAWSLSIEEYAYLFLPLILFVSVFLFPKKDRKHIFLVSTLLVILILFFFKINYYQNTTVGNYKQWSTSFRKVVIYRLDTIYIGFLLVYAHREFSVFFKKYNQIFAVLGSLVFFGIHVYIYITKATPQTQLAFYVFGYLFIVSVSLACLFPYALEVSGGAKVQRLIKYVSTRSYAIYLVNYSIVLLTIQRLELLEESLLIRVGYSIFFLVLTLLLSELLYRFVEQPVLRFRDKKYPSK